jgi:HPt (histidine-containing phosphotransfer) domain-containing protein
MTEKEKIVLDIDPDLADLVPGFLENRGRDVLTLQKSLGEEDWETIRILGHRMKGAGGGYGFHGITDLGSRLEQAAKLQDSAKTKELIEQLEDYIHRVEPRYV